MIICVMVASLLTAERLISPAQRGELFEFAAFERTSTKGRVDKGAGVIYGVKVCGLRSKHPRDYTIDALRDAAPLYENAIVYVNHPINPRTGMPDKGIPRRDDEAFGHIQNVRAERDGLYADLVFLKSHPLAARVIEAAETYEQDAPAKWRYFGLSHNADYDKRSSRWNNGRELITKIVEVRSVDLVCHPGTVDGLFESSPTETLTALEMGNLYEEDDAMDDSMGGGMGMGSDTAVMEPEAPEMDAELPAPDHQADLDAGFQNALTSLAAEYMSGAMDYSAACKRFGELLKAHGKLSGSGGNGGSDSESESDDTEPDSDADDEPEKKSTSEQGPQVKKTTPTQTQAERERDAYKALLEQGITTATPELVESLTLLPTHEKRAALLETFKAMSRVEKPKSSGPGTKAKTPAKAPEPAMALEQFVAEITAPEIED